MTTSELDFNIFLILFGVRRVNFCFFCFHELMEIIIWATFWFWKRHTHITIEFFCEVITVIDPENSVEDVYVASKIEIFPGIMISQLPNDLRNFLPFQKNSLRNSTVLNFRLGDKDSLVGEIIVDFHFSDAIILKPTFNNMFLEIGIESQNFSLVFYPRGLNSRDRFVFRLFSFFLEAKIAQSFGQFINQMDINILGYVLPLFLLTMIGINKLLSFVEILFIGIVENMTR